MKAIGITSAAVLALLLGVTAPARAQHEQENQKPGHSEQQPGGHEQGRPEAQQQRQSEHAQPRQQAPQQQHAQQQQQQVQRNQQQHAQQQQQVQRNQQQHAATTAAGPAQPAAACTTTAAGNQQHMQATTAGPQPAAARTATAGVQRNQQQQAQRNNHSVRSDSSKSGRAHGSNIAHKTGKPTTVPGSNAVAITAIASPMTVTADTLAPATASSSVGFPSWSWADTHASSTRAIGSAQSIPGRQTGEMTGTTTMTSTSTMSTMATISITADIPPVELRSTSRSKVLKVRLGAKPRQHDTRREAKICLAPS